MEGGAYSGLHFGWIMSGLPRFVWLVLGLSTVLLGVTGVTVWVTKLRSRRNRARRRQVEA